MTSHSKSMLNILFLSQLLLSTTLLGCQPKTPAVNLRIWQTETDKDAVAVLDSLKLAFEKSHPGVTIELESVSWSALADKLAQSMQAQNVPDLAHIEPFMAGSMMSRDALLPIDDVIQDIEAANGPIFGSVRDLQLYNGRHYGIAYAVGVTGFAYRRDLADKLHLTEPLTWHDYVQFVKRMSEGSSGSPGLSLLLPGGDPFFIDQLFAELVANNGGHLFDATTNRPLLSSATTIQALEFLAALAPYLDRGWTTQSYLDQFNRLATGQTANVPVTYVRATKAIEKGSREAGSGESIPPDPAHFALMRQPRGPSLESSQPTIATIDCEPYVIFKAAESRSAGRYGTNAALCKEFLRAFYSRDTYLRFCTRVPIHLTPIFERLAADSSYLKTPLIVRWAPWEARCREALQTKAVRPILMPDETSKTLPFLLELQSSRILANMVADVLEGTATPAVAAAKAQHDAEALIDRLGQRKWVSPN